MLGIMLVFLMVTSFASASPAQQLDRVPLRDGLEAYLLGVNYPWLNYGHDFGENAWGHSGASSDDSAKEISADFADMQSKGVQVVRWFLFGDGRASPEFDDSGRVTGFDEFFFVDFDKVLEIAEEHDIFLMPVLFDYLLADAAQDVSGVQIFGRSKLITDAEVRQSFLDNALKPLLDKYGQNRQIIAWDVINEPEGAMKLAGGAWAAEAVQPGVMKTFVTEIVSTIHSMAFQPVTLGSASRKWLIEWTDVGLDFYQFHYYEHMETDTPFDSPAADLGLDKPVILGEFPTKDNRRTMSEYLEMTWTNGYAGALAWSYRADDDKSDFASEAEDFAAWASDHADVVRIPTLSLNDLTGQGGQKPAQYDFEDGIMGWYPQDYITSRACVEVSQSDQVARNGQYSLEMSMNLIGADESLSQGEALVAITFDPPIGLTGEQPPFDLDGYTITIWVYSPEGSRGDPNHPNGFQILVKDAAFKSQYGIWHNIDKEDQWIPVTLTVSNKLPRRGANKGYIDEGFDPTQIVMIGLKMGTGGESKAAYKGPVYVDSVSWEKSS
ncbi:MAG: hypothetical protein JNM70_04025 [Anaerolineae bacterium]|nr:hypothetical protein [Anaerolineae bacterium]